MKSDFRIIPLNRSLSPTLQEKINLKTKPLGALGQLEKIALEIGLIQDTLEPAIRKPSLLVFAGDHGIANSAVSPYPQEVTRQMVLNFIEGGAAINVFARQNQMELYTVDAGVNGELPDHAGLIKKKIGFGTRNMLQEAAMTAKECQEAIEAGAEIVERLHQEGCNTIGFGEMGIGNTSAASLLMSHFCQLPLVDCVGSGTGLDAAGISHKLQLLNQVLEKHRHHIHTPLEALATYGGFEMAMMCGAFLQAAANKMIVLVDGFIASATLLAAHAMQPAVLDYCIFSHLSSEQGHQKMLNFFKKKPLLQLEMRLGEGTGAALALPLLQSAVHFLNQMASFESAGVSQKS